MRRLVPVILCLLLSVFSIGQAQNFSVENLPPVVVRTVPRSGDTGVDAKATTKLEITFSKKMMANSFSLVQASNESFPKIDGKPKFSDDGKTCLVNVKLEPGKTYVLWVNSQKYMGFVDENKKPSIPYLLVFETK